MQIVQEAVLERLLLALHLDERAGGRVRRGLERRPPPPRAGIGRECARARVKNGDAREAVELLLGTKFDLGRRLAVGAAARDAELASPVGPSYWRRVEVASRQRHANVAVTRSLVSIARLVAPICNDIRRRRECPRNPSVRTLAFAHAF